MKPVSAKHPPILETRCQACGSIEWFGFLPDEWARYVQPALGA